MKKMDKLFESIYNTAKFYEKEELKDKITKQCLSAVERFKKEPLALNSTFTVSLPSQDDNDWAVVFGWTDGFEEATEKSWYEDGESRLCCKLGFQPDNSAMQCDYDIDWDMPYDESTGEVCDSELNVDESFDESSVEFITQYYFDVFFNENEDDDSEDDEYYDDEDDDYESEDY